MTIGFIFEVADMQFLFNALPFLLGFSLGASFGFVLRGLARSAAETAEAEHAAAMARRRAHIESFRIVG